MDIVYSDRRQSEAGVRPLSTALKTLDVLDGLGNSPRSLRLADVAQQLGLSRATAYQRLLTLVEAGLVEQDAEGRYRLSMHVARLAAAALEQADLGTRVVPILEELAHSSKETASLAVLDRGLPTIVSRVDSDSVLRAEQKIGTTMSIEGSASGRILTAFADEAALRRLAGYGHPLASEEVLSAARENGYALSSGYTQVGVRAIAAPVFDHTGRCTAAVSLVMPETRFALERCIAPLRDAAASITRLSGGA